MIRSRYLLLFLGVSLLSLLPACNSSVIPLKTSQAINEHNPTMVSLKAKEAYQHSLLALEEHPDSVPAYLAAGRAALAMEDFEAAAMAFEGGMIVDEGSQEALFGLAQACEGLGANELAFGYYATLRRKRLSPGLRKKVHARVEALYLALRHFQPEPYVDHTITKPAGGSK